MGDAKLAGIAAEDIGKAAYGIFKAGKQYIGKTVGIDGESLTIDEMGEKLSKGLGLGPVKYNAAEADEYRGYGFPGADEMGNMFQVYRDFEKEMIANRNLDEARKPQPGAAELRPVRYREEVEDSRGGEPGTGDDHGIANFQRPTPRRYHCSWEFGSWRLGVSADP